jgi:hypothetical protein
MRPVRSACLRLAVVTALLLCGCSSGAPSLISPVVATSITGANPLFPTNSYDAHIRNLLLAGKISDALSYAKQHYSRVPAYLQQYAAAFDVVNRSVGKCQEVARAIHNGLSRLGSRPEYVAIRSRWDHPVVRMADGKDQTLSHTGYHVVVRVGDTAYDAYTGPVGMKFVDYISRVAVPPGFRIESMVVGTP